MLSVFERDCIMSNSQPTVADLFRRAQAIRQENPGGTYADVSRALYREFRKAEFPPADKLTIPEQDARAPEEDWTAGLPVVLRGIQQKNWAEIAHGIVLSLEQTEGYEKLHGSAREDWRDRSKGIGGHASQSIGKWLPDELAALAQRKGWR
jgi:hypothetical protein